MRVSTARLCVVVVVLLGAACGSRTAPTPGVTPAATTQVEASATPALTATALPTATAAPASPTAPQATASPAPTLAPTEAPVPTPPADPCQASGADVARNLTLSYTAARSNGLGSSIYLVGADGSQAAEFVQGGLAPSWSPNGQRLAFLTETGDQNRPYALRLVDIDGSGEATVPLDVAVDADRGLRWSPAGDRLALEGPKEGVYVVEAGTGQVINVSGSLASAWGPAWSPDGARLAFQAPLSVTLNNLYRVYTVDADGGNLTRIDSDTLNDYVQQWQSDGSRLLVKSGAEGAPQQVYLVGLDGQRQRLFGGQTYADHIAWSPNGKQMAYLALEIHFNQQRNITGSTQWQVVAGADGANPKTLQQLELGYGQTGFSAPQWSPDGRFLAYTRSVTNTLPDLYALDVCSGAETKVASSVLGPPAWRAGPAPSAVQAIVASPAVTPESTPTAGPPHDFAYRLAWTPDGQRLAAVTAAGVRFYDPASFSETTFLPNAETCCGLAALGARDLVGIDAKGTWVSVYDWQEKQLIFEQKGAAELNFQSAALSPDGSLLATGERYQVRLWDLPSGELRATFQTSDQADSFVTNVGFTADGRTLVSVTQYQGVVHRWDVASLKLRGSFRIPRVTFFVLGPGARQLIADYAQPGFELWEAATGRLLGRHPKIIGGGGEGFTAFSPDGRRVAVWGYKTEQGNTLGVWDVAGDRLLHEFGLTETVPPGAAEWHSAAFSPDGKALALGASDGTIYLYETDAWAELGRMTVPGLLPAP